MNVYTVTYLNRNYGSILQAYALQSCLKTFGANPVVIRKLIRRRFPRLHFIIQLLKPEKNYTFIQRVQRWLDSKKYAEKNAKLNQFIRDNIATQHVENVAAFLRSVSQDDLFLAGSDQIWSTLNGPLSPWYSFQWLDSKFRKYSYAASLGQGELTREQIQGYASGLAQFQVVSLRESQAVRALQPVFPDKIRQDLDPTLLHDGSFWRSLASPRLVKEPYVFVYMLRLDVRVIELAQKIAAEKGCKVIYTGLYAHTYRGVTTVCNAGVEDFLSYINHAEVVVTNSFHGTAFSVMFEKPFLSVGIASTSARVENLLGMTGLMSQYVTDIQAPHSLTPDFTHALDVLSKERAKSLSYLQSICQPCA